MTAITQAITSALLHFLWQGVTVAFVLWIGLFLLRRRSAQARYAASCAALAAMALLPAITAWTLYDHPASAPVTRTAPATGTQGAAPLPSPAPALPQLWIATVQSWALPVWSFGVLLFSIRLVWGCGQVSRMRRRGTAPDEGLSALITALARRFGIARPVRILIASEGESPSVVGWIRPVVLMPSAALLGLTAEQLEAVLAHELAHIRRHDYLVNLLQILLETVLFYHPAVWWISARIRHERELCCDDLAVRSCGDAVCYARALTRLERLRVGPPAMAMGSNSGSMLYRIQRLLGGAAQDYAPSKLPAILALALAIACFGFNIHWASGQETKAKVFFFARAGIDSPGVTVDLAGAAILHRNRVEYPGIARERGVEGTVAVELTLDAQGAVSGARILSGPAEFRSAVLHSVLDWHFAQSSANSVCQVRIQFDRAKAEAAPPGDGPAVGYSVTTQAGTVTLRNQMAEAQAVRAQAEVQQFDKQAQELEQARRANADLVLRREQNADLERSTQEIRGKLADLDAAAQGQSGERLALIDRDRQRLLEKLHEEQTGYAVERQQQAAAETTQFLRDQLQAAESAAANGGSEQKQQVQELRRKLEMAQTAQALASNRSWGVVAGRTLESIRVDGLPDAAKSELMGKLSLHLGDIVTEQGIEAATATVRQFDEHLEVNFGIAEDGQLEMHIAAPNSGLFQFRVRK